MDLVPLVVTAAAVTGVVLVLRLLARPHTVIALERGRATVVRGQPCSGLVPGLAEVAATSPATSGRVELSGGGHKLVVNTVGLDEAMDQRVRNVVHLYRDRIR